MESVGTSHEMWARRGGRFSYHLDQMRESQPKDGITIVILAGFPMNQRKCFLSFIQHVADIDQIILRHTEPQQPPTPDP